MPAGNQEISRLFNKMASLLEIRDENIYKIRAYRNAAVIIAGLPRDIAEMLEKGEDLTAIPGIGKELATQVKEIITTGTFEKLRELEEKVPPALSILLNIPGLGPKRVRALWQTLDIEDTSELQTAAREGKIRHLPGFGITTEEKILNEIDTIEKYEKRYRIDVVEEEVDRLVTYLLSFDNNISVTPAGSFRRRKETVGDIDILVVSPEPVNLIRFFTRYDNIKKIFSRGETRSTVILRSGIQADLRVVPEESFGAALYYFTGSKSHNIAVRRIANKRGLKINEYGVYRRDTLLAGKSESDVFNSVGLPWIPPELRENQGEIEAAVQGTLPKLITLKNIRGDLHTHTSATDGRNTIEEMARSAKSSGYEYLAVTDHTRRVSVAKGLHPEQILRQIKEIDDINKNITGIIILKGAEVDILEDGTLDIPDDILKQLDIVVGSVHFYRHLSKEQQTRRIIRAMKNPFMTILAHPTGRLINEREPYDLDIEAVLIEAAANGVLVELNANPARLDLPDIYCRLAKQLGVKLTISTDAHSTENFHFMKYGIDQARRGWIEPENVINTLSLPQLLEFLKTRRMTRTG